MGKIIKWIWWLAVSYILCVHLYLQNAASEKYIFLPSFEQMNQKKQSNRQDMG